MSSLSPTIILKAADNRLKLLIGAAGGTKLISSIIQASLQNLKFDANIKKATDAIRIHYQLQPNELRFKEELPNVNSEILQ
ncbi:hypothetical protein ACTXT7_011161 [Hymenolepis weldensis]